MASLVLLLDIFKDPRVLYENKKLLIKFFALAYWTNR